MLDDGDAQAALRDRRGGMLARSASTEDDHVVVHRHDGSSSPACSRTMYSAYQSGQSGSARPMRASCSPCAAAARCSAVERSLAVANDVAAGSTRPGSRVVISWNTQPLPSGSSKVANDP